MIADRISRSIFWKLSFSCKDIRIFLICFVIIIMYQWLFSQLFSVINFHLVHSLVYICRKRGLLKFKNLAVHNLLWIVFGFASLELGFLHWHGIPACLQILPPCYEYCDKLKMNKLLTALELIVCLCVRSRGKHDILQLMVSLTWYRS